MPPRYGWAGTTLERFAADPYASVTARTSVHTVYLLRYARLYYSPPEGGTGATRALRDLIET